jgi:hypothetical protein
MKNEYNCAPNIWKKFSEKERILFNAFYKVFENKTNYPPDFSKMKKEKEYRYVIAHNLSIMAIDILNDIVSSK